MKRSAHLAPTFDFRCITIAFLLILVPRLRADFRPAPPIALGGVLQTSNVTAYAVGPLIAGLDRAHDFSIEGWVIDKK